MIAINHPALGMNPHQSGDTATPIYGPGVRAVAPTPMQPVRSIASEGPPPVPVAAPTAPSQHSNAPGASSSSAGPGAVPTQVSNLVDPVTGMVYAGFLTPDAQTLYNSGSLVTGGNQLTPQGSALAAQGDLITGTPAPTASQIAAAAPTPASTGNSFMDWLSEETLFAGYPNGLVAAGGVILAAWLFGGKKGRR